MEIVLQMNRIVSTQRQICVGSLNCWVTFCKRATNHSALWQTLTLQDKASYASLPPSSRWKGKQKIKDKYAFATTTCRLPKKPRLFCEGFCRKRDMIFEGVYYRCYFIADQNASGGSKERWQPRDNSRRLPAQPCPWPFKSSRKCDRNDFATPMTWHQ